jgi:hypothetical protein
MHAYIGAGHGACKGAANTGGQAQAIQGRHGRAHGCAEYPGPGHTHSIENTFYREHIL